MLPFEDPNESRERKDTLYKERDTQREKERERERGKKGKTILFLQIDDSISFNINRICIYLYTLLELYT